MSRENVELARGFYVANRTSLERIAAGDDIGGTAGVGGGRFYESHASMIQPTQRFPRADGA
jgi:hypothetical protein